MLAKNEPGLLFSKVTSFFLTPLHSFNASKKELCDSASLNSPLKATCFYSTFFSYYNASAKLTLEDLRADF
jgi:hypothetical protein